MGCKPVKEILKNAPQTAVLILSIYAGENDVRTAFAAGVRGYLLKNAIGLDLRSAIRYVAQGKRVLRREQANHKLS